MSWTCIEGCGACCHLDLTERPGIEDYLSAAEFELYRSLIGPDGWCIHYDTEARRCQIYDRRPDFCRVTPTTFQRLYGIGADELDGFAIACCREQIRAEYGSRSLESLKFEQAIGFELPGP